MSQDHMTVRQLIERLQVCDPEAVVVFECDDGYYSGALTQIETSGYRAVFYDSFVLDRPAYGLFPPSKVTYEPGIWVMASDEPDPDAPITKQVSCVVFRTS